MNKLRIALAVAGLVIAFSGFMVTKAFAFPPPYDPFLPQYELSPVVPAIKARGMQNPYRVENTSGMLPRWAQQVSYALDTASSNPQSSGRILAQWINYYRDDANPVSIHRAESTAAFESFCGAWAIGCAQWYTLPGINRYRAAAMVAWGDDSVAAVVRHEDAHTTFNACDQYLHGDPAGDIADLDLACRYSGSSSTCTGNPDTVMDCNLAARFLQAYDVEVFLLRFGIQRQPPPPTYYEAPDGWRYYFEDQHWYSPSGVKVWGPCDQFRNRPNLVTREWVPEKWESGWSWDLQLWLRSPEC